MLAVFDKAVAKGPEALKNLDTDSAPFSALKDGSFIKYFNSVQPDPVSLNFGSSGFIAYSSHKQNPLLPRYGSKKLALGYLNILGGRVFHGNLLLRTDNLSSGRINFYYSSLQTSLVDEVPAKIGSEARKLCFTNNQSVIHLRKHSASYLQSKHIDLFSVVDDIFCLFQGHIENIAPLKQQYGLTKTANEVSIVIEAYRTLRDRGPYPVDHVVRDINGKFAFILYDGTSKSLFTAVDADGSVPFFWGMDSDNNLVLSDDEVLVEKACNKSFAPFPEGCFFTSSGGLRSFEFPQKELKATPWVDSLGEVRGAIFLVDEQSRKETGMPRVGSASNWSSQY